MVISLKFIPSCLALVGRAVGLGQFLFLVSPSQRKKIRNVSWESYSQTSEKTARIGDPGQFTVDNKLQRLCTGLEPDIHKGYVTACYRNYHFTEMKLIET